MVHLLRTFHVTLAQDYKLEIEQATTILLKEECLHSGRVCLT